MLDTDIEGLDPRQATDYVLAFITTLKQTVQEIDRVNEEEALWRRRETYAREKGESSLADQAGSRAAELEIKKARLEGERQELVRTVATLKDKLQRIRTMGTRLIDTDRLLAELQMIVGEKDTLSLSLKEVEAKAELERLKKKMSGGE